MTTTEDIKPREHDGEEKEEANCEGTTSADAVEAKNESTEQEDDVKSRRLALLEKIALFERRGAILPTDAHTLRFQVHDSTSGQWEAVENRLKQLALNWNPYQDYSADDRRDQEKARGRSNSKDSSSQCPPDTKRATKKPGRVVPRKKKDFYELLELSEYEATPDEVKKQFRKLALRSHPDKQKQASAAAGDDTEDVATNDSTEFARLRLAYETLSDPEQRAAYDAKLAALASGSLDDPLVDGIHVKDQIKLEAATDFASLEWMARVKHKMDVMDRIAEWAKLLQIRATDLRFETGEACIGRGCGKIVSMDRDLECYGSPRRRVYVCLLHKYIHACDETCTSHYGDTELDRKVCSMRACWLVQNWLFDQLQMAANRVKQEEEETKGDDHPSEAHNCELVASEIHLGDTLMTFSLACANECCSETCQKRFQFLEEGIFVCRRHGTPHVCTYEQCNRKELRNGQYICWVSGKFYGHKREDVGTGTRTRRLVYTDRHGESSEIEMDVPVLLPLGKMTSYLLEGGPKSAAERSSSLSPPRPSDKTWGSSVSDDAIQDGRSPTVRRAMTVASNKRAREEETSPARARIRRHLVKKVQQADSSFYIYMKVPPAVANLPKVALELNDQMPIDSEASEAPAANNILPIRVRPRNTLNYIKHWMEELTEQQISIWDQQIFWSDTLIGDEAKVMTLEEHGINDGCYLELRLHDDCPLLLATWGGKQSSVGEYNTVQISKEAEEDLDEQQEEFENVIAAEEYAFEQERLQRKREKLANRGAMHHLEVIQYDGSVPRLVGVIPEKPRHLKQLTAERSQPSRPINVRDLDTRCTLEKDAMAMRSVANAAEPVKPKAENKTK